MSLENGTYLITSANPETGHLDLSPVTVPIFPPVYSIVGSLTKDLKEQVVTSTGNNTYTIYSTTHSKAAWALQGTIIVASEAEDKVGEFSIETAGEGVYTIRVPNKDEVATLGSAGTNEQLHVDGQDGSPSQLWEFMRLDE